jgi:hypothetical protein
MGDVGQPARAIVRLPLNKELRLQQTTFVVSAFYLSAWIGS